MKAEPPPPAAGPCPDRPSVRREDRHGAGRWREQPPPWSTPKPDFPARGSALHAEVVILRGMGVAVVVVDTSTAPAGVIRHEAEHRSSRKAQYCGVLTVHLIALDRQCPVLQRPYRQFWWATTRKSAGCHASNVKDFTMSSSPANPRLPAHGPSPGVTERSCSGCRSAAGSRKSRSELWCGGTARVGAGWASTRSCASRSGAASAAPVC